MIGKKHLMVSVLVVLCVTVALAAVGFGSEKEKAPKWPVSTQVTVWWREPVPKGVTMTSSTYNASGFGQLHIIGGVLGLGAEETLDVRVYVAVWNDDHTVYDMIPAYMQTLDWPFVAVTIPVPAEEFYFAAITDSETCTVTLSFYLTWA